MDQQNLALKGENHLEFGQQYKKRYDRMLFWISLIKIKIERGLVKYL